MRKTLFIKGLRGCLSGQKKYAIFTVIISKPDVKKTIYLRLSNSKKDNKSVKEHFMA